jgi:regulator of nonsense transcripts 2
MYQTRTVELPSDSTFAIAMKTQQAAEREEQQRIKSLVLNYDLRDGEEQDGDLTMSPLIRNYNIHAENTGIEKAAVASYTRPDKSGNNRSGQRARKLQLSDVDWYDPNQYSSQSENTSPISKDGSASPLTKSPSAIILGLRLQPTALPNNHAIQQGGRNTARASAQVGRLTRKEILNEHASRKAASKLEGEK